MNRLLRHSLLLLVPLAAACATPVNLPSHWLGVTDLAGRVSSPDGVDSHRIEIAWENVSRRQPDRSAESGRVERIEGDGRFTIPDLLYGTYELTVRYAGGTPRIVRVTIAEPDPQVEIEVPAGRVVVSVPEGAELDRVTLRPFAADGRDPELQRAPAGQRAPSFEGLAPGNYVVSSWFGDMPAAHTVVRVPDGASSTEARLGPQPEARLTLNLRGDVPSFAQSTHLLAELYARAPDERCFDFGAPVATRQITAGENLLGLPPGRWGLLLVARDAKMGRFGAYAWIPDVDLSPDGQRTLDVELVPQRQVVVKAGGARGRPATSFGVRFGADIVPASRLLDVSRSGRQIVSLPTQDCAVVTNRPRRRDETGPLVEEPILAGPDVQEIYVIE